MTKIKIKDTSVEPAVEPEILQKNRVAVLKDKVAGKGMLIAMAVLLLGAAGAAGYFYKQLHDLKNNSSKATQVEVDALVKEVGEFIALPEDEQPTVATVTDPTKLQDQAFFAKAKAGYKVLIYTNAKKAILYDPVNNKIIEVAPINLDGDTTTKKPATQEKSQIPIKVLNASNVSGLAAKVADKLKAAGYSAVTVSDSPEGPQPRTAIVFELKYSADAEEINKVFNGQASLEAQVGASGVTITLGADFKID